MTEFSKERVATNPMYLHEFHVRRFRDLVSTTHLQFAQGTNILLGANGTGKTTLLELVSAMTRSDFSRFASEPLTLEYSFSGYDLKVTFVVRSSAHPRARFAAVKERDVIQHERANLIASADITIEDPRGYVKISANSKQSEISYSNGPSVAGPGLNVMEPFFVGPLFYDFTPSSHDLISRLSDALLPISQQGQGRFDEALEYFNFLTRKWSIAAHNVNGKRWLVHSHEGAPEDIDAAALAQVQSNSDVDVLKFTSDGDRPIKVLGRARDLLGFRSASMRVERTEKTIEHTTYFGNASFEFVRGDGTILSHRQLSFGQKRLLAFLFYASSPGTIIADELVNGLHHSWISECLKEVANRQVFLTSQNPLLLDHLIFESAAQVKNSFIRCASNTLAGAPNVQWSNFSQRDADIFFSAYQSGIQPVGEILKTRGLW